MVTDIVAGLSLEEREVISLFYQGEQSVAEIAQITGLTESNVKVRLFRARQKLKLLLENTVKELN
jgi:RNA polymerase sigma factor (sigma-70 family)